MSGVDDRDIAGWSLPEAGPAGRDRTGRDRTGRESRWCLRIRVPSVAIRLYGLRAIARVAGSLTHPSLAPLTPGRGDPGSRRGDPCGGVSGCRPTGSVV